MSAMVVTFLDFLFGAERGGCAIPGIPSIFEFGDHEHHLPLSICLVLARSKLSITAKLHPVRSGLCKRTLDIFRQAHARERKSGVSNRESLLGAYTAHSLCLTEGYMLDGERTS